VARATRPFRSATRRPEWQAVTYFSKTYDWPRAVSSRSERRVAARDRRVACATPGKGGTGNLPVPLGHWPDGTERGVAGKTMFRKTRARRSVPSGGSPLGTGGSPVPVRLRRQKDKAVEVRFCAVKNRAVSNRNCVAAMRGGEQRNENDQSVTQVVLVDNRRELDSVGVSGRVCW